MNWKSISENDLMSIVRESWEQLPEYLKNVYNLSSFVPKKIQCKRTQISEDSEVYSLLYINDLFLIYDDIEDEFAVVKINSKYAWELFPDLESALKKLAQT